MDTLEQIKQSPSFFLPNGKLNTTYVITKANESLNNGNENLAESLFQTILNEGTLAYIAKAGLARIAKKRGNFQEAVKYFTECLKDRFLEPVFLDFVSFLIQEKKFFEAIHSIRSILSTSRLSSEETKTCLFWFKQILETWLKAPAFQDAFSQIWIATQWLEIEPSSSTAVLIIMKNCKMLPQPEIVKSSLDIFETNFTGPVEVIQKFKTLRKKLSI